MALNARLRAVADFVRGGALVVDVGCDHALLPIELIRSGKASRVIASDIGEGPLSSARKNIERAGLDDRIETRLSDGLAGVSPDEVDHVIVAGMGGDLISWIIDAAKWTRSGKYRFIFQPMTSADDLRRYLIANGFVIDCERAVYDAHRLYTVMQCRFDGNRREYPPEYEYIGEVTTSTAEGRDYLQRQIRRIDSRLRSLENARDDHPEKAELETILQALKKRLVD